MQILLMAFAGAAALLPLINMGPDHTPQSKVIKILIRHVILSPFFPPPSPLGVLLGHSLIGCSISLRFPLQPQHLPHFIGLFFLKCKPQPTTDVK